MASSYSVDAFSSQVEQIYSTATKRKPCGNPVLKLGFAFLSIAFAAGVSWLAPPPPPKICGTLHGPAITAPRLRFPDGRPVAYSERGLPKQEARYKVVLVHGYGGSRLDTFPCTEEILEELGVYMVSFDRAGYGESHPFPHRSASSEAYDIEHIADELQLGPTFHVIAIGVGAYAGWGCIKYIPHRLGGIAMISPVANFWWPGVVSSQALEGLEPAERYTVQVAHYAPQLLYWFTAQKWFPSSNMERLSQSDDISELAIQQGVHESIHRDLMVQFGNWDFDITGLKKNPFKTGSVHVWQSDHDPFFPSSLQAWIRNTIPWIHHHTIPGENRNAWLQISDLPENVLVRLVSTNQTHA